MKLVVAEPADRQAKRIDAWWAENRLDAIDLFRIELEETFRYICKAKNAGVPWPTARRPKLRRYLLRRTNVHVYFVTDDRTETVTVEAIQGGAATSHTEPLNQLGRAAFARSIKPS